MRTLILLAALFALGFAPQTALAGSAPAISKAEARSLPERQVKRKVMRQLADILSEERFERTKPPKRPLEDMTLVAEPRGTRVPGLCQLDRLSLEFESGDRKHKGAETPARVSGFTATRFFHFKNAPPDRFDQIVDYENPVAFRQCQGLKLWEDEFFSAPDDRVATDGYLLVHRVMDAVIAGSPPFEFSCDKFKMEENRSCSEIVAQVKADQISSIKTCEAVSPEFQFAACYRVDVGERSFRIIASPVAYGPNAKPPLSVIRAEMSSMIILWHTRVD